MSLKPIETHYNGYRFRSRLEARWAVFFDSLNIKYQYESEGFDLDNGIWYLPDFYLPDLNRWIEIKPTENISDEDSIKLLKFHMLVNHGGEGRFCVLVGEPNIGKYKTLYEPSSKWGICPICNRIDLMSNMGYVGMGNIYLERAYCVWCDCLDKNVSETKTGAFFKGTVVAKEGNSIFEHRKLTNAYTKAVSARFEHGETPKSSKHGLFDFVVKKPIKKPEDSLFDF